MSAEQFDKQVDQAWKTQVTGAGIKAPPGQYGLQSYGDSQYLVKLGAGYLLKDDGTPVVIDLTQQRQRFSEGDPAMSYFGLNAVNQNQQLDEAASNPAGFNTDVGFFDNSGTAAVSGLYSGLVAKPDQLLWAGMDKIVSPIAKFVNENTSINDTSAEYIAEQRKLAEQQVKRLTPDAATTGTAGQVLHGLFDMGGQAVVGSLLAGPAGGAAAVTALQGFSEFERLTAQGVDFRTAQEAGLVQGVTAGAGTLIPMSLGLRAGGALAESVGAQLARTGESAVRNVAATAVRAAPDIAYAAGTNIAFGMAQRGLTAKTLRDGGYNEMANQYDVFDRQFYRH